MERLVNARLFDFFDQKGTLPTLQLGGRVKRTTIDHNLSLEETVMKAQANSKQVVSIFFDMENTYKLTWRHGILTDINEAGKEEKIFNFIENFLKPSFSKVKVNDFLSVAKV